MKSCREFKEMISAYLDKELEKEEEKAFEEHLQSCDSCRQEYEDMLYIVGLCTDSGEVELPDDFKMGLHARLLQEKSVAGLSKSFWNKKYIGALTSVAAVLLLAVLFRGTFINGNMLRGTAAKADSSPKVTASQNNSDGQSIMSKNTDAESAQIQISGYTGQGQNDAQESARSDSSVQDRMTAHAYSVATEAIVTNKVANITVVSENPQEQADKIKQLAADNGGEVWQPSVKTALNMTVASETPKDVVVNLKIPNLQYDSFKASLVKDYGTTNVNTGEMNVKDETATLDEMGKTLADLDARIKQQEAEDASSDTLKDLKKEKDSIEAQIEQKRFDSDFVFITVKIN